MKNNKHKELRWILRGFSGLLIVVTLVAVIGDMFWGEVRSEPTAVLFIVLGAISRDNSVKNK